MHSKNASMFRGTKAYTKGAFSSEEPGTSTGQKQRIWCIPYPSWGPIVWPFLCGPVASKGIFDNSRKVLEGCWQKQWGCWPQCWHSCWQACLSPCSDKGTKPASTPHCFFASSTPANTLLEFPDLGSHARSPGSQAYRVLP